MLVVELADKLQDEGFLETIRILRENPTIAESLAEREKGEFMSEEEFFSMLQASGYDFD